MGIQIDSTAHNYEYQPVMTAISKIEVGFTLPITPVSLIFSQKIFAIFNRPRVVGRDFFDITYIGSQNITPDYTYLNSKLGVQNEEELRKKIAEKMQGLDFAKLAEDVHAHVYDEGQLQRVAHFPLFWEKMKL